MVEQVRIKDGLLFLVEDYSYELYSYGGEPFLGLNGQQIRFHNELNEDGTLKSNNDLTKGEQWLKDNIKPEKLTEETRISIYGNEGIVNTVDFYKTLNEEEVLKNGYFN